jgi:transposase
VRNGTTSLFAALDVATGKVMASFHHRQRHQEFLRFLERVDAAIPENLEIHLVMDNYGTHKMAKVKRWFARRPRYHLHFTPTSASWLNQVERFFSLLTDRRIRRGTFASVRALESAIRDYLTHHNQNPRPFAWTADADSILKKITRFCMRTSDSGH